ncbi:MAG TPA: hypothetical protein VGQ76_12665 [Thermoanaerobaculia bacterium]|jgi:hypothetical protein|nr:hypothetical protein [Thermoanaerobaculia bacterium]
MNAHLLASGAALIVCSLVAVFPAAAEPLSDLRAVLQRYPAKTPLVATASVRVNSESDDVGAVRDGAANFDVEAGPVGMQLRVLPATLAAAQNEATSKKRDPNSRTPTRTAMVALTVFDVMDALDIASMLLNELDGATLIKATAVTHAGKRATLLHVKVKPTLAGTSSKYVNEPKIELRIWVGSDGLPIAAERDSNYSASFLFLKAANVRKEHWEVAAAGDRLYASRADQSNRATAAGKKIASSHSVSYAPK